MVNVNAQNSFSFSVMPLPSLNALFFFLWSQRPGPGRIPHPRAFKSLYNFYVFREMLGVFCVLFFFIVFVGLHYGMTSAFLGFECPSVSVFWIPFPGLAERVCSLWSCSLPKRYECGMLSKIFFV